MTGSHGIPIKSEFACEVWTLPELIEDSGLAQGSGFYNERPASVTINCLGGSKAYRPSISGRGGAATSFLQPGRIKQAEMMLPPVSPWPHVWLGLTAEHQIEADCPLLKPRRAEVGR